MWEMERAREDAVFHALVCNSRRGRLFAPSRAANSGKVTQ